MTMKTNSIKSIVGSSLFKGLRLGIPIIIFLSSIGLFINTNNNYSSWFLILTAISIILLNLGLREKTTYINTHASIIRVDLLFVDLLRPIFRLFRMEDVFLMSFFKWNNEKVLRSFSESKSRNALLLIPHCVQWSKCTAPVLDELSSCYNCGLCHIENLVEDSLKEKWNIKITNRSYKAYIEAKRMNPDLIVAVSCIDRLLKGVRKLPNYPSFLIPLELPYGMCVDATFNYEYLSEAMMQMVHKRDERKPAIQIIKHA